MRASPVITQFNGGELSPLIAGRVDVAKFPGGCQVMDGFIPTTQGPAIACPGFRFVSEVKDSADRTWFVRFEFSVDQAYVLEFGDLYIRFYTNRGVLLSAGIPYEIASPYTAAQLTASDGTFAIRAVQTGDVVRLFHGSVPTQKLSRLTPTNWTIAPVEFSPPPFKDENSTTTTVYASAATGTGITLTASASLFTAAMVGEYIRLDEKDVRSTAIWEAGKAIGGAGVARRANSNNYSSLAAGTTGSVRPTHTVGAVFDGDPGVQWEYLDSGFGYAKITAVGGPTSATADVVSRIPANAVGAGNATTRWSLQLWNSTDGYPTCGTFFRERLVAARGNTLSFSVAGDFDNFATEVDGSTTGDAGFVRTLSSDRNNSIRWLSPGNVLLVGTEGDEWAVTEATTQEAFGPSNAQAKPQSTYGSSNVGPLRVGDVTLFAQKAGRKVRAMAFRFEEDGFKSPDVTEYAEHITKPKLVDMAYQQEPWSVVWGVRSDGKLAALSFNRDQEVIAWFTRTIAGGVVECVECIPSPDATRDDVWIIVRLTVAGVTRRYVCYLEAQNEEDTAPEDWFYLDCGATYSGPAVSTISGLGYLEGLTVDVLADGARHPQRVVTAGAISLQLAASKVHVGLPTPGTLAPMEINAGQAEGTAIGKTKRIHRVTVRVLNSMGGRFGPSLSDQQEMRYRSASVPMGAAQPAFTGNIESKGWGGDSAKAVSIYITRDKPMPLNVIAVMPQVDGEP